MKMMKKRVMDLILNCIIWPENFVLVTQRLRTKDEEEAEKEGEYPDVVAQTKTGKAKADSDTKKGWRRVRKIYSRSKQCIFIAATLPVNEKKTARGILKHMFQDVTWVSGNFLHRNSPKLKQKWVEVTVDSQVNALIEDVISNSNNKTERTMVFANTVEAVEAVADILEKASIQCYRYHKNHKLEERANIDNFTRTAIIL